MNGGMYKLNNTCYAIETELGILDGRDAIHIDSFKQKFNKLIFKGEINGKFCKEEYKHIGWYTVEFQFNGVKAYSCKILMYIIGRIGVQKVVLMKF